MNYVLSLMLLERFEEARPLLRRTLPVVRRVLGEVNRLTLTMRKVYARVLLLDAGATLADFREAVETLEDLETTARRVLGSQHPLTMKIETSLRCVRAELRARETPPTDAREDGDLDEVEDA